MTCAGKQKLKGPKNHSFATSFMHWKWSREWKEDHRRVEESKAGLDYGIVCFVRVVTPLRGVSSGISKVC